MRLFTLTLGILHVKFIGHRQVLQIATALTLENMPLEPRSDKKIIKRLARLFDPKPMGLYLDAVLSPESH